MSYRLMLNIAGFVIEIRRRNSLLEQSCADYVYTGDRSPEIVVDFDGQYLEKEIESERKEGAFLSIEQSEHLAIYRVICTKMLEKDCFLMHASVIADGESCYAFTAPSGTGKSTHARLWRESFPHTFMVNDDKPLIKIQDGEVFACGTPWCGKHNLGSNVSLPLRGIGIIERSKELFVRPVDAKNELTMILNQIYRPKTPALLFKTLDLLNIMLEKVPLYRIGCDISSDSAIMSYNTLTKEGKI